jgi:hypothetical protein
MRHLFADKGYLMTTSVAFRLSAAAFLLTLPVLTSVGRCAGQETRRGVDGPGVRQGADDAQRAAERRAGARVLAAATRAALLVLFDPDEAYQLVKDLRDEIRFDPGLSEACRERLESQLEWAFRGVWYSGSFVKQQQIEWLVIKAEFRARLDRWRCQLERGKRHLGLLLGTEEPLLLSVIAGRQRTIGMDAHAAFHRATQLREAGDLNGLKELFRSGDDAVKAAVLNGL